MAENNGKQVRYGWDGGNRSIPLNKDGLPIVKDPGDKYSKMLRRVEVAKQPKPKKKS